MNNHPNPEKESVSEKIETLTQEMQDLYRQRDMCLERKKELMASEDPARGIFFHQEIHNMQMEYLRLEVEADTKRRQINRLHWGYEY